MRLAPGSGAVVTERYRLIHRLQGAPDWTTQVVPAADGGALILGYATGDQVELRAVAENALSSSASTVTLLVTVGSEDAPIPQIGADGVSIEALLGGARLAVDNTDPACVAVQLYHAMSDTLDRGAGKMGGQVSVEPARRVTLQAGDMTRSNLFANAGFDDVGAWTLGDGWSIASGVAEHVAGDAGSLTQPLPIRVGQVYRMAFTRSAGAGSVSAALFPSAGVPVSGTDRASAGRYVDRLTAPQADGFAGFTAGDGFAGSIDDAVIYAETSACLPQGINYFWIEPINADGRPGEPIGPFSVNIE